ncbi:MAG: fused MFS/spermidine synthase [Planctomycetes bacterium]|nr:fused MFS/spermidine synthase [Planctomycetota bacterium]
MSPSQAYAALSPRTPLFTAGCCLFASGGAALLYEILWLRYLTLIFGVSCYALSTILVAFMTGLGLGGYVLGRFDLSARKALALYAAAETLIGIYAWFSPQAIHLFQPLYIQAYRSAGGPPPSQFFLFFAASCSALILPTFLMGATLPLIVSAVTRSPEGAPRTVGILYFINTLGGVAGAGLTGFLFIPALGMEATLALGSALNFLAAGVALALRAAWAGGPGMDIPAAVPEADREAARSNGCIALAIVFLSGAASMIYEVVWTRLISLLVGSSTYAFTLMLMTFLLGMACGSLGLARRAESSARPALMLAALQAILALFVWASTPLLDRAQAIILVAYQWLGIRFSAFLVAEFLVAVAILFLPALILGATFPLATRLYLGVGRSAARSVGDLYGLNTLGAISGAVLGGFYLLGHPAFGSERALLIGSFLNLVAAGAGLALALPRRPEIVRAAILTAAATFVLVYHFLPGWNRLLLVSGVFDHPSYYEEQFKEAGRRDLEALRKIVGRARLLFFAEGPDATVSVSRLRTPNGEQRKYLRINGKVEATSAYEHDLATQVLIAQLGLCLHPSPRRVAVIGLGSGISLGSVLTHPEVESVDCLEISPLVARAARQFDQENGRALDDRRVRLILNDARNHFMATDRLYDVIASEPSNPWITGVSNLFTLEHYQRCQARLAPGGLMCQWFHLYNTTPELVRMTIRTFLQVFPHTTLWTVNTDLFMVGAPEPWRLERARVTAHLQESQVLRDLERIHVPNPDALVKKLLMRADALRAFTGEGPIHTDDRPLLEFSAPWALYEHRVRQILESLRSFKPPAHPED